MEKELFWTLVKGDHKLGGNEYVTGRIHGFMTIICDMRHKPMHVNIGLYNGSTVMAVLATKEKYEEFKTCVEKYYPGLCLFDWQG